MRVYARRSEESAKMMNKRVSIADEPPNRKFRSSVGVTRFNERIIKLAS